MGDDLNHGTVFDPTVGEDWVDQVGLRRMRRARHGDGMGVSALRSARRLLLGPCAGHKQDAAVADELNWRRAGHDGGLPHGMELQWLGTAGFRISYENYTLLVDPYVTRAPISKVLQPRPLRSEAARLDAYVPRADAILIGHTHFDHALDVPAVAARDGCTVYGSSSLERLMHLHGRADLAAGVEAHRTYEIGPFSVTFVPSAHSKLLAGLAVPFGGELTCDSLAGLHAAAYRCGQVWGIHIAVAGVTFYHQGSADLVEEEIRYSDVDYCLLAIAGRAFSPNYVARILRLLSPRVIVPHHYDNFFSGFDQPMGFSVNVNLARFPDEVAAVSKDFDVRSFELLQTVNCSA